MNNKKCKTETSVANLIKPKKNYLYECHCMRCCDKKVDLHTQEKHTTEKYLWKSEDNRKNQKNTIMARKKKSTNFISNVNPSQTNSNKLTKRKRDDADSFHPNKPNNKEIPPDSFPDSFQKNNEDILPDSFLDSVTDFFQLNNEEESTHTLFSSNFRIPALNNDDNYLDKECNQYYIYQEEEGEEDDCIDQKEENDDDDNIEQEKSNDDDDDIKNFFTSPEIDSNEVFVMESLNDSMETEIILWAFKFQQRFRLSDIALEALIKFLHIVLTRLNRLQFKTFPKSLYLAKKMLLQIAYMKNSQIIQYPIIVTNAIIHFLHSKKRKVK